MRPLFTTLLDIIFPERSPTGQLGSALTESEVIAMHMYPVSLQKILLRQRGLRSIDHVFAAGSYHSTPLLKDIIRAFKYGGRRKFSSVLTEKIAQTLPGLFPELAGVESLCPVPLHWSRKFSRGFNQAELLARELGVKQGWSLTSLLKRKRPTGHQAHRNREARLIAPLDAFAYIGPKKAPKRVVLVDDIFTTGATLDACAKTLKDAGVKRVDAIVVAHG